MKSVGTRTEPSTTTLVPPLVVYVAVSPMFVAVGSLNIALKYFDAWS